MNASLNKKYGRIIIKPARAWQGGFGKDQIFIFRFSFIQIDKKLANANFKMILDLVHCKKKTFESEKLPNSYFHNFGQHEFVDEF